MAQSAWSDPVSGASAAAQYLVLGMRRANNRPAQAFLIVGQDTTANPADWQALLDHFASFPGMMSVELREGAGASRVMTPDVEYEPLPPTPLD